MRRVWLGGLAVLLLLASCGPAAVPTLSPDEARSFADRMQASSENLLTAISSHDYDSFIKDMDAAMRQESGEADFEELYELLDAKIGRYISSKMVRVEAAEQAGLNLQVIIYDARFEQEDHVTVRVVYNMATDPPLVGGLWFDSPKLRE